MALAALVLALSVPAQAAPPGFVEMSVRAVIPSGDGQAVVLADAANKTLLPIWIGPSEAMAIQLRLERRRFERPLTHDLLDTMIRELGGEVVKVHVDDLKSNTFVATLFIKKGERTLQIDARPSDSIALAVGNRVPVFVSRRVLERAGQDATPPETPAKEEPAVQPAPKPAGVTTL